MNKHSIIILLLAGIAGAQTYCAEDVDNQAQINQIQNTDRDDEMLAILLQALDGVNNSELPLSVRQELSDSINEICSANPHIMQHWLSLISGTTEASFQSENNLNDSQVSEEEVDECCICLLNTTELETANLKLQSVCTADARHKACSGCHDRMKENDEGLTSNNLCPLCRAPRA